MRRRGRRTRHFPSGSWEAVVVGGGTLTAEITFPGGSPTASTLIFSQSGATDKGDYVAPTAGFTQHCYRARNAGLANFFVDFRPDASGGRVEVVFWNGEIDPVGLTVASGYMRDLPPYDVVIKQAGTSIYSARIPRHYWATRWRYQSAVRPVVRTLSTVVSDGYMMPMSTNAARLTGNNISTGKAWSGLPYSDPSGSVIRPTTPPAVGTYTPFMPPDLTTYSPPTTLTANASAGATSIALASSTGMFSDDIVVIALDDTTHYTTRFIGLGYPCTIASPLPSSAARDVTVTYGAGPTSTRLGLAAPGGSTSVVLGTVTGLSVGNNISITLDSSVIFTVQVTGIGSLTGYLISSFPPLPSAASSGNTVWTAINKLNIIMLIEIGGERPELGIMTEWAADYLLNGTSSSLNAIRQQAEMASSEWPYFLSDLSTGAAVNFKTDIARYNVMVNSNAYASHYQAPWLPLSNGWDFHENDSHWQMHPYIPCALTEDPYFVEGCQYLMQYSSGGPGAMLGREGKSTGTYGSWGSYGWGDLNTHSDGSGGINGAFTMGPYGAEIRTAGNGTRNLAMTYKVSPVSPPSWLLPRSYYASLSSDYAKVVDTLWTANASPTYSVFHMYSTDPWFQAFEQAYAVMGIALADLVGMPGSPSWNSILGFYFGMIDGLSNGTSGWNNQTPQIHDYTRDGSVNGVVMDSHSSWGSFNTAMTTFMKSGATFPSAASPGNQQGGSMQNVSQMYAAAACAKSRGVAPGSAAAFNFLNIFIDYNYPNASDGSMFISFFMKCGFTGT